jgi:Family of unknown function (DUF6331)
MPRPTRDDISIGQDRWIKFIDVTGRQEHAASIDHLITPMESFWVALERNCVAECCGINAFSLWPEDIRSATSTHDRKSLANDLSSLREFVEREGADIFESHRLNNYFDRQVLLQLIDHIRGLLKESG